MTTEKIDQKNAIIASECDAVSGGGACEVLAQVGGVAIAIVLTPEVGPGFAAMIGTAAGQTMSDMCSLPPSNVDGHQISDIVAA